MLGDKCKDCKIYKELQDHQIFTKSDVLNLINLAYSNMIDFEDGSRIYDLTIQ